MRRRTRLLAALGLAVAALALATAALGRSGDDAPPLRTDEPLATVTFRGGLCPPGACTQEWTITTEAARDDSGKLVRPLDEHEREELMAAIEKLDYAQIVNHPFDGLCSVAYDYPERIYRFRGLEQKLATCTFDLEGVEAVRLVNALIDSTY